MTYKDIHSNHLSFNARFLKMALEGITHEESMQSFDQGNCINWIVGHVVLYRTAMIKRMGGSYAMDLDLVSYYEMGTSNISTDHAVQLDSLLSHFEKLEEAVIQALESFDETADEKKSKNITFLCFHEAYHIGQIGMLRRLLGKEGFIK